MYRDHRKGPGGPPGGATYLGGPHGLKWEGNQPLVGWYATLGRPLHLGLETLKGWGRLHLALGPSHPLGRRPSHQMGSEGAGPPLPCPYI